MRKLIYILWLLYFLPFPLVAQITIWSEDFNSIPNGTQQNPPKWTTMHVNMNGTGFWGVVSGEFWVNGMEGQNYSCNNFWWSEVIDISQFHNVIASYDVRGAAGGSGFECDGSQWTDLVESSYRIDGGVWTRFCENGYICTGAGGFQTVVKQEDLAGNTLEIRIRLGNKAIDEEYWFDNILVEGDTDPSSPIPGIDTTIRRCSGDSVLLDGQYRKKEGRYILNLTNQFGCDSIVAVGLVIDSTRNTTITESICEGDSILLEGEFQKTSGFYTDSLQTGIGCDSILTTQLIVLSKGGDTLDVPICQGDSFLVNGIYRKSAGFYNDTISRGGCDSISIINLIIKPTYSSSQSFSICQGENIMVNGKLLNSSGVYYDTLMTNEGCDSVIITNLTVHPNYNQTVKDTICSGDSIFLENRYRFNPGTYRDTFQTAFGCDSMLTTQLTVTQAVFGSDVYTICQGDSILIGGKYRKTAGFFNDTITSVSTGCDSINLIQLNVTNRNYFNQQLSICQGDSVLINGIYRKSQGIYNDTVAGVCGDITTYNLTVDPNYSFSVFDTICQGDSLLFDGVYRKITGAYYDSLQTQNGCDSIIFLNLTVHPSYEVNFQDTICLGDSILIGKFYRYTSGSYYDTLISNQGCDSILITNLVVLPRNITIVDTGFCDGDSLLIDGQYYHATTSFSDTSNSRCGDIITYNITEYPKYTNSRSQSICQGDSVFLEGTYQKQNGVYFDTLASAHGCDSILITNLIVVPAFSSSNSTSICSGDSILLAGKFRKQAGVYRDTLLSSGGCDSVIATTLSVLPSFYNLIDTAICSNDSFLFSNRYIKTAGTYFDSLETDMGCDSIKELRLSFFMSDTTILPQVSVCENDSFFFNDQYIKQAGTYFDTLLSSAGCDSILQLNLDQFFVTTQQDTLSICEGDSALVFGTWKSTEGTYIDTVQTLNGNCDSLIEQVKLQVYDAYFTQKTLSICEGDSVEIYGIFRSIARIYNDTLQASSGCDSILSTNLIVYQNKQIRKTETICEGDTILIAGSPRYEAGVYKETLASAEGCDSIVITELKVTPAPKRFVRFDACAGDTIRWNGNIITQNDSFIIKKPAAGTCDSLIITTFNFVNLQADFNFLQTDQEYFQIEFKNESSDADSYQWNFGDEETSTEKDPYHIYADSGTYVVKLTITNNLGCSDSLEKLIIIRLAEIKRLHIPSAFTPNNDGVNDLLEVAYSSNFQFDIQIFNRWGELLFRSENLNFKWDGTYNGNKLPNGTYYYIVNGYFKKKGSITILH